MRNATPVISTTSARTPANLPRTLRASMATCPDLPGSEAERCPSRFPVRFHTQPREFAPCSASARSQSALGRPTDSIALHQYLQPSRPHRTGLPNARSNVMLCHPTPPWTSSRWILGSFFCKLLIVLPFLASHSGTVACNHCADGGPHPTPATLRVALSSRARRCMGEDILALGLRPMDPPSVFMYSRTAAGFLLLGLEAHAEMSRVDHCVKFPNPLKSSGSCKALNVTRSVSPHYSQGGCAPHPPRSPQRSFPRASNMFPRRAPLPISLQASPLGIWTPWDPCKGPSLRNPPLHESKVSPLILSCPVPSPAPIHYFDYVGNMFNHAYDLWMGALQLNPRAALQSHPQNTNLSPMVCTAPSTAPVAWLSPTPDFS